MREVYNTGAPVPYGDVGDLGAPQATYAPHRTDTRRGAIIGVPARDTEIGRVASPGTFVHVPTPSREIPAIPRVLSGEMAVYRNDLVQPHRVTDTTNEKSEPTVLLPTKEEAAKNPTLKRQTLLGLIDTEPDITGHDLFGRTEGVLGARKTVSGLVQDLKASGHIVGIGKYGGTHYRLTVAGRQYLTQLEEQGGVA